MSPEQRWYIKLLAAGMFLGALMRWTGELPPCTKEPAPMGAGFYVTSNCKVESNAASR